jgi:hypothetical protein
MEKPILHRGSPTLVWLPAALLFWMVQPASAGGLFTVNVTGDTHAVNPASSPKDSSGNVTLRSAIEAANAQAGPTTINVPGGTFNLSLGELTIAPNGANTITIVGAGSEKTAVNQADGINRVFNIDANSAGGTAVTISGLTISGGHDQGDQLGGAAILAGSVTSVALDTLVVQGCVITGNHCAAPNSGYTSQPGGGIQMAGGNLTVSSCIFVGNSSAASQGGAIAFIAPSPVSGGSGGSLTVTTSSFLNNSMTNGSGSGPDGGGAVYIDSTAPAVHSISDSSFQRNAAVGNQGATFGGAVFLNMGTLNVDRCSFAGNSVLGQGALGGAIYVDSGTLNVSLSRIAGNAAANGGSGIYSHGSNGATTIATNNWWGCNAGPTLAGCDQAAADGGTLNVSPWIVLSGSASPSTIIANQSSTLTATLAKNSAGDALSQANLTALAGVPITFDTAILGTISAAQLSLQSDGTANAKFNAGSTPGIGHANATVDNGVYTFSIAINQPPAVTTQPSDQSACPGGAVSFTAAASGAPVPSLQWQRSTDGGVTWVGLLGQTSATLSFSSVTVAQNGEQYRAVFSSAAGIAVTIQASLIVNAPPVAGADNLVTSQNTAVVTPIASFLANDSSPIGGTLNIQSVANPSAAGAAVALNGTSISYTPPANFIGTDSFAYTLSDGRCTAQGTVSVTVSSGNGQPPGFISITRTAAGFVIQFEGTPSNTYVVQWTYPVNGPWADFSDGTVVADSTGLITYTDATGPTPQARFYRVRSGP